MLENLININTSLSEEDMDYANIIPWSTPIYSFGKVEIAKIATLGINPSNREFEDLRGNELDGNLRRFHTLKSLNIKSWKEIDLSRTNKIKLLCDEYFQRNPYDQWFKKLDYLFSGSSYSYYFPSIEACHLDLVPYATEKKWSNLTSLQREFLLKKSSPFLGDIIKNSSISYLILNGSTVIKNFELISDVTLKMKLQPDWALKRRTSNDVKGYSFEGQVKQIGDVKLKKEVKVFGFNHNIQSSYGITNYVQKSIRNWFSNKIK